MNAIRIVAVTALTALLVLVLYLPAQVAPERFVQTVRTEHTLNARFWGDALALRLLGRAMSWQALAHQVTPAEPRLQVAATADVAVQSAVAALGERLAANAYFRNLRLLWLLASYRASVLLQCWQVLALLAGTMVVDGLVGRSLRQKEFVEHNPEMFACAVCLLILLLCALVVAFVLPLTLPSMLTPTVCVLTCGFLRLAIANYQKSS